MKKFWLSPSALNILKDCPRCFWLDKITNVKRPRGIFPSLPGGMDGVIKTYFDAFRIKNKLPPEVTGKLPGGLFSHMPTLEKWRSWRTTNLKYNDPTDKALLSGALDDCLQDGEIYIPLDYKTRGSPLTSDPAVYYQSQMDCYCLMLESQGHKTNGTAYLLYYWPLEVHTDGMIKFAVTPYKINTSIDSAKQLVTQAIDILSSSIPKASPECEYCDYAQNRNSSYKDDFIRKPEKPAKPTASKPSITPKQPAKTKPLKKIDPPKDESGQFYFF
ncbi:MAG: PD-(D/E)XK nuclease family protein [bacterium]